MLIRYTYIFLIKFLVIFLDFHWFFLKSDFSLVIGTRVAKNSANIAISEITLVPKQRQYFLSLYSPKFTLTLNILSLLNLA